jgi:hypothetical protein
MSERMVMAIINEEGNMVGSFHTDKKAFKIGEIIEHERLEGKHKVMFCDPATVSVIPV